VEQTSLEIATVDDRIRPKNEDDGLRRALFLCHSLHPYCAKQVRVFLKRCRDGEFGPDVEESVRDEVPDWQIAEATKELATMCLHMTGVDQGALNAPPWLIEFLIESLKEADMLFPEPVASSIITAYADIDEAELDEALAFKLRATLGVPPDENAHNAWMKVLETMRPYRNELLFFALTQPPDTLRLHLQMMG
jgi:hypothetical protein